MSCGDLRWNWELAEWEGGRERPGSNRWPEHQLDLNQSQHGPEITLYFTLIPENFFFQCIKCMYHCNMLSYLAYCIVHISNSILHIVVIVMVTDSVFDTCWDYGGIVKDYTGFWLCIEIVPQSTNWADFCFYQVFLEKESKTVTNTTIIILRQQREQGHRESRMILRKYSNLWVGDGGSGGWCGVSIQ